MTTFEDYKKYLKENHLELLEDSDMEVVNIDLENYKKYTYQDCLSKDILEWLLENGYFFNEDKIIYEGTLGTIKIGTIKDPHRFIELGGKEFMYFVPKNSKPIELDYAILTDYMDIDYCMDFIGKFGIFDDNAYSGKLVKIKLGDRPFVADNGCRYKTFKYLNK